MDSLAIDETVSVFELQDPSRKAAQLITWHTATPHQFAVPYTKCVSEYEVPVKATFEPDSQTFFTANTWLHALQVNSLAL